MLCLSGLACILSFSRLAIYVLSIGPTRPSPFDMQILQSSPVTTEYNMAFTLSAVTLFGVAVTIIGMARKEQWRRFGIVLIVLHCTAWWWMSELTFWAFNPPPGVDY